MIKRRQAFFTLIIIFCSTMNLFALPAKSSQQRFTQPNQAPWQTFTSSFITNQPGAQKTRETLFGTGPSNAAERLQEEEAAEQALREKRAAYNREIDRKKQEEEDRHRREQEKRDALQREQEQQEAARRQEEAIRKQQEERRQAAQQAEAARIAQLKAQQEAEQRRLAAEQLRREEEERRLAEQRLAEEQRRLEQEKRLAEERKLEEQKRLAEIEQKRLAEEAEKKRIALQKQRVEAEQRAAFNQKFTALNQQLQNQKNKLVAQTESLRQYTLTQTDNIKKSPEPGATLANLEAAQTTDLANFKKDGEALLKTWQTQFNICSNALNQLNNFINQPNSLVTPEMGQFAESEWRTLNQQQEIRTQLLKELQQLHTEQTTNLKELRTFIADHQQQLESFESSQETFTDLYKPFTGQLALPELPSGNFDEQPLLTLNQTIIDLEDHSNELEKRLEDLEAAQKALVECITRAQALKQLFDDNSDYSQTAEGAAADNRIAQLLAQQVEIDNHRNKIEETLQKLKELGSEATTILGEKKNKLENLRLALIDKIKMIGQNIEGVATEITDIDLEAPTIEITEQTSSSAFDDPIKTITNQLEKAQQLLKTLDPLNEETTEALNNLYDLEKQLGWLFDDNTIKALQRKINTEANGLQKKINDLNNLTAKLQTLQTEQKEKKRAEIIKLHANFKTLNHSSAEQENSSGLESIATQCSNLADQAKIIAELRDYTNTLESQGSLEEQDQTVLNDLVTDIAEHSTNITRISHAIEEQTSSISTFKDAMGNDIEQLNNQKLSTDQITEQSDALKNQLKEKLQTIDAIVGNTSAINKALDDLNRFSELANTRAKLTGLQALINEYKTLAGTLETTTGKALEQAGKREQEKQQLTEKLNVCLEELNKLIKQAAEEQTKFGASAATQPLLENPTLQDLIKQTDTTIAELVAKIVAAKEYNTLIADIATKQADGIEILKQINQLLKEKQNIPPALEKTFSSADDQIEALNKQLEKAQGKKAPLERAQESFTASYENINNGFKEIKNTPTTINLKITHQKAALDLIKPETLLTIQDIQQRLENLEEHEQTIKDLDQNIEEYTGKRNTLNQEITQLKNTFDSIQDCAEKAQVSALSDQITTLPEIFDTQDTDTKIANLKQALESRKAELEDANNAAYAKLSEQLKIIETGLNATENQIENYQKDKQTLLNEDKNTGSDNKTLSDLRKDTQKIINNLSTRTRNRPKPLQNMLININENLKTIETLLNNTAPETANLTQEKGTEIEKTLQEKKEHLKALKAKRAAIKKDNQLQLKPAQEKIKQLSQIITQHKELQSQFPATDLNLPLPEVPTITESDKLKESSLEALNTLLDQAQDTLKKIEQQQKELAPIKQNLDNARKANHEIKELLKDWKQTSEYKTALAKEKDLAEELKKCEEKDKEFIAAQNQQTEVIKQIKEQIKVRKQNEAEQKEELEKNRTQFEELKNNFIAYINNGTNSPDSPTELNEFAASLKDPTDNISPKLRKAITEFNTEVRTFNEKAQAAAPLRQELNKIIVAIADGEKNNAGFVSDYKAVKLPAESDLRESLKKHKDIITATIAALGKQKNLAEQYNQHRTQLASKIDAANELKAKIENALESETLNLTQPLSPERNQDILENSEPYEEQIREYENEQKRIEQLEEQFTQAAEKAKQAHDEFNKANDQIRLQLEKQQTTIKQLTAGLHEFELKDLERFENELGGIDIVNIDKLTAQHASINTAQQELVTLSEPLNNYQEITQLKKLIEDLQKSSGQANATLQLHKQVSDLLEKAKKQVEEAINRQKEIEKNKLDEEELEKQRKELEAAITAHKLTYEKNIETIRLKKQEYSEISDKAAHLFLPLTIQGKTLEQIQEESTEQIRNEEAYKKQIQNIHKVILRHFDTAAKNIDKISHSYLQLDKLNKQEEKDQYCEEERNQLQSIQTETLAEIAQIINNFNSTLTSQTQMLAQLDSIIQKNNELSIAYTNVIKTRTWQVEPTPVEEPTEQIEDLMATINLRTQLADQIKEAADTAQDWNNIFAGEPGKNFDQSLEAQQAKAAVAETAKQQQDNQNALDTLNQRLAEIITTLTNKHQELSQTVEEIDKALADLTIPKDAPAATKQALQEQKAQLDELNKQLTAIQQNINQNEQAANDQLAALPDDTKNERINQLRQQILETQTKIVDQKTLAEELAGQIKEKITAVEKAIKEKNSNAEELKNKFEGALNEANKTLEESKNAQTEFDIQQKEKQQLSHELRKEYEDQDTKSLNTIAQNAEKYATVLEQQNTTRGRWQAQIGNLKENVQTAEAVLNKWKELLGDQPTNDYTTAESNLQAVQDQLQEQDALLTTIEDNTETEINKARNDGQQLKNLEAQSNQLEVAYKAIFANETQVPEKQSGNAKQWLERLTDIQKNLNENVNILASKATAANNWAAIFSQGELGSTSAEAGKAGRAVKETSDAITENNEKLQEITLLLEAATTEFERLTQQLSDIQPAYTQALRTFNEAVKAYKEDLSEEQKKLENGPINKLKENKTEFEAYQQKLTQHQEKLTNLKNAKDLVIEIGNQLITIQDQLSGDQKLPEEFVSVRDYVIPNNDAKIEQFTEIIQQLDEMIKVREEAQEWLKQQTEKLIEQTTRLQDKLPAIATGTANNVVEIDSINSILKDINQLIETTQKATSDSPDNIFGDTLPPCQTAKETAEQTAAKANQLNNLYQKIKQPLEEIKKLQTLLDAAKDNYNSIDLAGEPSDSPETPLKNIIENWTNKKASALQKFKLAADYNVGLEKLKGQIEEVEKIRKSTPDQDELPEIDLSILEALNPEESATVIAKGREEIEALQKMQKAYTDNYQNLADKQKELKEQIARIKQTITDIASSPETLNKDQYVNLKVQQRELLVKQKELKLTIADLAQIFSTDNIPSSKEKAAVLKLQEESNNLEIPNLNAIETIIEDNKKTAQENYTTALQAFEQAQTEYKKLLEDPAPQPLPQGLVDDLITNKDALQKFKEKNEQELTQKLTELKTLLDTATEAKESLKEASTLTAAASDLDEATETAAPTLPDDSAIKTKIDAIQQSIDDLQEQIQAREEAQKELEKKLRELNGQIDTLNGQRADLAAGKENSLETALQSIAEIEELSKTIQSFIDEKKTKLNDSAANIFDQDLIDQVAEAEKRKKEVVVSVESIMGVRKEFDEFLIATLNPEIEKLKELYAPIQSGQLNHPPHTIIEGKTIKKTERLQEMIDRTVFNKTDAQAKQNNQQAFNTQLEAVKQLAEKANNILQEMPEEAKPSYDLEQILKEQKIPVEDFDLQKQATLIAEYESQINKLQAIQTAFKEYESLTTENTDLNKKLEEITQLITKAQTNLNSITTEAISANPEATEKTVSAIDITATEAAITEFEAKKKELTDKISALVNLFENIECIEKTNIAELQKTVEALTAPSMVSLKEAIEKKNQEIINTKKELKRQAEEERLRKENEEKERKRLEEERTKQEEERKRQEDEKKRLDDEKRREEEGKRLEEENRKKEEERKKQEEAERLENEKRQQEEQEKELKRKQEEERLRKEEEERLRLEKQKREEERKKKEEEERKRIEDEKLKAEEERKKQEEAFDKEITKVEQLLTDQAKELPNIVNKQIDANTIIQTIQQNLDSLKKEDTPVINAGLNARKNEAIKHGEKIIDAANVLGNLAQMIQTLNNNLSEEETKYAPPQSSFLRTTAASLVNIIFSPPPSTKKTVQDKITESDSTIEDLNKRIAAGNRFNTTLKQINNAWTDAEKTLNNINKSLPASQQLQFPAKTARKAKDTRSLQDELEKEEAKKNALNDIHQQLNALAEKLSAIPTDQQLPKMPAIISLQTDDKTSLEKLNQRRKSAHDNLNSMDTGITQLQQIQKILEQAQEVNDQIIKLLEPNHKDTQDYEKAQEKQREITTKIQKINDNIATLTTAKQQQAEAIKWVEREIKIATLKALLEEIDQQKRATSASLKAYESAVSNAETEAKNTNGKSLQKIIDDIKAHKQAVENQQTIAQYFEARKTFQTKVAEANTMLADIKTAEQSSTKPAEYDGAIRMPGEDLWPTPASIHTTAQNLDKKIEELEKLNSNYTTQKQVFLPAKATAEQTLNEISQQQTNGNQAPTEIEKIAQLQAIDLQPLTTQAKALEDLLKGYADSVEGKEATKFIQEVEALVQTNNKLIEDARLKLEQAQKAEADRKEQERKKKEEELKKQQEEQKRQEEAKRKREEEEKRKQKEKEEERKRLEEERKQKEKEAAEAAERKRQEEAAEAERKRIEDERKQKEAELKKQEEEQKRLENERRLNEEAERKKQEEERKRLEDEKRIKAEEELKRQRLAEELKLKEQEAKLKEEAERRKQEERTRLEEERRKQEDEERKRLEESKKKLKLKEWLNSEILNPQLLAIKELSHTIQKSSTQLNDISTERPVIDKNTAILNSFINTNRENENQDTVEAIEIFKIEIKDFAKLLIPKIKKLPAPDKLKEMMHGNNIVNDTLSCISSDYRTNRMRSLPLSELENNLQTTQIALDKYIQYFDKLIKGNNKLLIINRILKNLDKKPTLQNEPAVKPIKDQHINEHKNMINPQEITLQNLVAHFREMIYQHIDMNNNIPLLEQGMIKLSLDDYYFRRLILEHLPYDYVSREDSDIQQAITTILQDISLTTENFLYQEINRAVSTLKDLILLQCQKCTHPTLTSLTNDLNEVKTIHKNYTEQINEFNFDSLRGQLEQNLQQLPAIQLPDIFKIIQTQLQKQTVDSIDKLSHDSIQELYNIVESTYSNNAIRNNLDFIEQVYQQELNILNIKNKLLGILNLPDKVASCQEKEDLQKLAPYQLIGELHNQVTQIYDQIKRITLQKIYKEFEDLYAPIAQFEKSHITINKINSSITAKMLEQAQKLVAKEEAKRNLFDISQSLEELRNQYKVEFSATKDDPKLKSDSKYQDMLQKLTTIQQLKFDPETLKFHQSNLTLLQNAAEFSRQFDEAKKSLSSDFTERQKQLTEMRDTIYHPWDQSFDDKGMFPNELANARDFLRNQRIDLDRNILQNNAHQFREEEKRRKITQELPQMENLPPSDTQTETAEEQANITSMIQPEIINQQDEQPQGSKRKHDDDIEDRQEKRQKLNNEEQPEIIKQDYPLEEAPTNSQVDTLPETSSNIEQPVFYTVQGTRYSPLRIIPLEPQSTLVAQTEPPAVLPDELVKKKA